MATEILAFEEIIQSQSSKYVTHNNALRQIEGWLRVLDRDSNGPPATASVTAGDTYIVDNAVSSWVSATTGDLAHYYASAWNFSTPKEGIDLWVNDENIRIYWDGSSWVSFGLAALSDVDLTSPNAPNDGDILKYDSASGQFYPAAETGGAGETNTASNVNAGGVGVFKQKSGVDLEFRGVNAGSSKITITLDAGNNEIDVDVAEANIDHDALTNFVANEHINHTGVTLTAGVGLTGGGTIAANRTFDLDVNGLTEDTTPDPTADYLATYDADAATHKKVLLNNLLDLGDLSDVDITSPAAPAAGDVLSFDSVTSQWFPTNILEQLYFRKAPANITDASTEIQCLSSIASMWFERAVDSSASSTMTFAKSRGTVEAQTAVQNGDETGLFAFRGHDGTDSLTTGCGFGAIVDGAVSSNNVPMALIFDVLPNSVTRNRAMTVFNNGQVIVGSTGASKVGQFGAHQESLTGAMPVIYMEQDDVSEEFMRFRGTAASATLTQSIVNTSDVTTATIQGYLKVNVIDDGNQITDQDYFIPIYTLA